MVLEGIDPFLYICSLSMNKQITRVWSFASDSNPNIEYQTVQYADGTTSCNCKGWTRRVAADGSRSCKHYVPKHIMLVM